MKKSIIWFRNDNYCLDYAAKNNHKTIFLYIFDNSQHKWQIGSAAKWFLHQALKSLKNSLKEKYNADLLIKIGNPQKILEDLVQEYEINSILWNRLYEPFNIKRDSAIKQYFQDLNLEVKTFNSSLLFEPWQIKNLSGSYFKVFTPFWKKCLSKINDIEAPIKAPENLEIITTKDADLTTKIADLKLEPVKPNWAKNWSEMWQISEDNAHDLAFNFVQNKVLTYKENRDFPAADNTSILSPYLNFGLISPKHLYFKTIPFLNNENTQCFLSEIGWREFSYHLLYHFPDLPEKNFKSKFDKFPWLNNEADVIKWQKGQTGYPIIDAGMRELYQTGFMHNRVRMVVASFLIKNLLIDWRIGQDWFWDCLLDANLAANAASWQWVAGSGADAAPYFRIFNPILQSQKFDKEGQYIRKWLPEIANLSNQEIHFPQNRTNYFTAIIDLNSSRNRALENYKIINQ